VFGVHKWGFRVHLAPRILHQTIANVGQETATKQWRWFGGSCHDLFCLRRNVLDVLKKKTIPVTKNTAARIPANASGEELYGIWLTDTHIIVF
jgi:hypothetical protein